MTTAPPTAAHPITPAPADDLDVDDLLDAFIDWSAVASRIRRSSKADEGLLLVGLRHPTRSIREAAARIGSALPSVMTVAARDPRAEVRTHAATATATPPGVLAGLVDDRSLGVRRGVAANPSTPPSTLELLSADPQWEVRWSLASNPAMLPPTVWPRVAGDSHSLVRRAVAARADLPVTLLERLAEDADAPVRATIAARDDLSTAIGRRLAGDSHAQVFGAIASNPNVPRGLLTELAGASSVRTRERVAANPGTPHDTLRDLCTDRNPSVRAVIARRNDVPALLVLLANDDALDVRQRVADNRAAPTDALEVLARCTTASVRSRVAVHPMTSPRTLRALLADHVAAVRLLARRTLVERYGAHALPELEPPSGPVPSPADGWDEIYRWLDHGTKVDQLVKSTIGSPIPLREQRRLLALPDVSNETLRAAAEYHDHRIRRVVTERARTPDSLLRMLADDPAASVRAAASAAIADRRRGTSKGGAR